MKYRNWGSLVSIAALSLGFPGCGDDSTDVTEETDSTAGEETTGGEDAKDSSDDYPTSGGGETTSDSSLETEETSGGNTSGLPRQSDVGTSTNSTTDLDSTEEPPGVECPEVDEREIVNVPAVIDHDVVWTCDKAYLLPSEPTVVTDGATLTIEPGVEVWGQGGSALVITRGSKIDANGRANAPIVFTSGALPGQRAPGQWGGVLLLGGAPVNDPDGEGDAEGIDPTNGYSAYGGDDEHFDCGSMSYVRIEFGGYQLSADNELNNLGVAGCGSQTELHHIQVHKGSDDGIEFWGGSPVVHHIVASSNSDDSFDWTSGFSSKVQFVLLLQDPGDADVAIEADNSEDLFDATPLSAPVFYNLTAIGGRGDSTGVVLRRGSAGKFYNSIFSGFRIAVDVRDVESVARTEGKNASLTVEHSLFFDNGTDGETHFPVEVDTADNDVGFDELAYFTDAAKNNVFDLDPEFGDASSLRAPNLVPSADGPAARGAKAVADGFIAADYLGAFEPGGADWTAGWTAYPEN